MRTLMRPKKQKTEALQEGRPLGETLRELEKFGRPRISKTKYTIGWVCYVDMAVVSAGSGFEVRSEFGHPTPEAAADQCRARVMQAIRDISRETAQLSKIDGD